MQVERRRPRDRERPRSGRFSPAVEKAIDQAEKLGLAPPERPGDAAPELPEDLTGLGDSALMDLFTELTRWADYSAVQLGLAAGDENAKEEAIRGREARALINEFGHHNDKQDMARARKRVAADEYHQALLEAYALRKLLEGMDKTLERDQTVVSREITRRVGREPQNGRERRWSP